MMYVITVDTKNRITEYTNTFRKIFPSYSYFDTVSSSNDEGSEQIKITTIIPHHTNKILVRVSKNFFIVFDLGYKYTM